MHDPVWSAFRRRPECVIIEDQESIAANFYFRDLDVLSQSIVTVVRIDVDEIEVLICEFSQNSRRVPFMEDYRPRFDLPSEALCDLMRTVIQIDQMQCLGSARLQQNLREITSQHTNLRNSSAAGHFLDDPVAGREELATLKVPIFQHRWYRRTDQTAFVSVVRHDLHPGVTDPQQPFFHSGFKEFTSQYLALV
jgi:hypothetical protein